MNAKTRSRAVMIAVALLFLTPVLAALFLNSQWSDWKPGSTKNLGRLLQPPPALPKAPAILSPGQWGVMYVAEACDDACVAQADLWQRLYRTTGRDMEKVQPVIVVQQPVADAIKTEITKVAPNVSIQDDVPAGWFAALSESLGESAEGHAAIVDPRGYVALDYPDANPQHVRKDLDRLLTWSKE